MDKQSFYTRQMLMQYGQQLVSARRLARREQALGKQAVTEDAAALLRKVMIERISREIIENLIFSGSQNPIVQDVRKKLELRLGEKFVFHYPPADLAFKIFREQADGTLTEVGPDEKNSIMDVLWEVTLKTVDESTL